jgi:hypothetical protein
LPPTTGKTGHQAGEQRHSPASSDQAKQAATQLSKQPHGQCEPRRGTAQQAASSDTRRAVRAAARQAQPGSEWRHDGARSDAQASSEAAHDEHELSKQPRGESEPRHSSASSRTGRASSGMAQQAAIKLTKQAATQADAPVCSASRSHEPEVQSFVATAGPEEGTAPSLYTSGTRVPRIWIGHKHKHKI